MRKTLIRICSYLLILCFIVISGCNNKTSSTFSLNDKYYETSSFIDLDKDKLDKLISEKESFAVFIYQPLCTTSYEFNKVVTQFLEDYQMSFYKIAFSDIKETSLGKSIKYYPSLVIYRDGKIIDYLESDNDEDLEYYKSLEGFEKWFSKYVSIKKSNNNINSKDQTEEKENTKIDAKLENVVYDKNKVNIYFFWGDGCPHCEEEFKFLESIETEFGDFFTLHTFEVWYNEDNANLLDQFAEKKGDEVTGVPYTIIGDKSFKGFSEKNENQFLEAIKTQYKNSYDIYFDD